MQITRRRPYDPELSVVQIRILTILSGGFGSRQTAIWIPAKKNGFTDIANNNCLKRVYYFCTLFIDMFKLNV